MSKMGIKVLLLNKCAYTADTGARRFLFSDFKADKLACVGNMRAAAEFRRENFAGFWINNRVYLDFCGIFFSFKVERASLYRLLIGQLPVSHIKISPDYVVDHIFHLRKLLIS